MDIESSISQMSYVYGHSASRVCGRLPLTLRENRQQIWNRVLCRFTYWHNHTWRTKLPFVLN